jgi:hypothetical protein
LKSQTSVVQQDINRLQVDFDQLKLQQSEYLIIKDKGFFFDQSRREAEKILQSIQQKAGVIAAVAKINAGELEDNEEAQKANYKILKSTLSVHIDALDPAEIYKYVYLLEEFFPGQLIISNLLLERKTEPNGEALRSISEGGRPIMASADVDIIWRTMIPQPQQAAQTPGAGAGPGMDGNF